MSRSACLVFSLSLLCVLLSQPNPARAANVVVQNSNDSGPGSLRAAIQGLPAGEHNEIRFAIGSGGVQTIALQSSLPDLRGTSVLVDGASSASIIIDGQNTASIFRASSIPLTLRSLSLKRGLGALSSGCVQSTGPLTVQSVNFDACRGGAASANGYGGAISATGSLTVRASTFTNNLARASQAGGNQSGGAIYVRTGPVLIEDSRFEGNRVEVGGGPFADGGAISIGFADNAVIRRSTFRGNRVELSQGYGGALFCSNSHCVVEDSELAENTSDAAGGAIATQLSSLTVRNSSFYRNRGASGGAISVYGDNARSAALDLLNVTFSENRSTSTPRNGAHLDTLGNVVLNRVANTVFGDPVDGPGCALRSAAHVWSGTGYNLHTDSSCLPIVGSLSRQETPARLGLGTPVNGSVALLQPEPGSTLIDNGNPATPGGSDPGACPARDIYGVPRPQDGDGDGSTRCDVGAREVRNPFRSDIRLDDPLPGRQGAIIAPPGIQAFGYRVANVGDINGDGIDDVGITANVDGPGNFRGRAWVIYGRAGGIGTQIQLGSVTESYLGFSIRDPGEGRQILEIAAAGDFNGDGFDDVIIGAPGQGSTRGKAWVVFGGSGRTDLTLAIPNAGRFVELVHGGASVDSASFGRCITGVGDMDGNGVDDIAVGRPGNNTEADRGEVYVIYAANSGQSLPAVLDVSSGLGSVNGVLTVRTQSPDAIGQTCVAAPDSNGDGRGELLLGTPDRRSGSIFGPALGGAHLLYGRGPGTVDLSQMTVAQGHSWIGSGTGNILSAGIGNVLSAGHDVDGDGIGDILLGTLSEGFQPGTRNQAYLLASAPFSSATSTLSPTLPELLTLLSAPGPTRGLTTAGITPDMDGDGRPDLVSGAPFHNPNSNGEGEVSVLLSGSSASGQWPPALMSVETQAQGPTGYRILPRTDTGLAAQFGASLTSGDFDNDGLGDLAIGAPGENRVWLILSQLEADIAVSISAPATATPGQTVNATIQCRNLGPQPARVVGCRALTTPGDHACIPANSPLLAPGAAISCPLSFVMPAVSVDIQGRGFSITQDQNAANNLQTWRVSVPGSQPAPFKDGFEPVPTR